MKKVIAEQPLLFDIPEVPKRQKSKWEQMQEMSDVSQAENGLIPPAFAAKLLDVSPQRVGQLMDEGTFRRFEFFGKPFLSVKDVRSFIDVERVAGRPWTEPSAKRLWKQARELAGKK